ncbi:MAG TPA: phosphoenolpyruvate carboxykinase (ATP) [Puia sp.]|nr:phosphoenolpyruvate carboxykinase (ATP) [Puia sp.]
MHIPTLLSPQKKLTGIGLTNVDTIHYQLQPEELIRQVLGRREGALNNTGALVINTGEFTGRSPKDKFIVKDEISAGTVNWNDFNLPLEEKYFQAILKKITVYFDNLPEIWVRDCYACADRRFRLNIRVINEIPAMDMFACNMFLRPVENALENFNPEWHMLCAPGLKLNPAVCGTRQHNAVVVSFTHKMILIAGTGYTGEIKKSIFGILNFILPHERNVLSMHCSANVGKNGDTALFFGLSGTGKTTLSADPKRRLIGDDEHGWTSDKIFNFEGGCYAKCINLSEKKEPEIFQAVRKGALAENVTFFPGTNTINFDDGAITENTRVSYPLNYISNSVHPSIADAPKNIFFLTCDAYGILPPISKLTAGQAMYQFISGYTAKIPGTETGIKEPKLTFSACFGAPFMPLHPVKYAEMLGSKIKEWEVKVWLVNTGWSGGPYLAGSRIKLVYTRAMIAAALEGKLDYVEYKTHPIFQVAMPVSIPEVDTEILDPVNTWNNKQAYIEQARCLAGKFIANFKQYEPGVTYEIQASGPVF